MLQSLRRIGRGESIGFLDWLSARVADQYSKWTVDSHESIYIIKGSLVEKLPSYGDLKMQRVQYSNSSSSSAK